MLVHIHYFQNAIKYDIPEFSVTMNKAIRDDRPIVMYIPDPEHKMIKSKSYCLDYSWKPISVEFEVPSEMMDVDFEHVTLFGRDEIEVMYELGQKKTRHDLSLHC
jgi:hypothetical protein